MNVVCDQSLTDFSVFNIRLWRADFWSIRDFSDKGIQ